MNTYQRKQKLCYGEYGSLSKQYQQCTDHR